MANSSRLFPRRILPDRRACAVLEVRLKRLAAEGCDGKDQVLAGLGRIGEGDGLGARELGDGDAGQEGLVAIAAVVRGSEAVAQQQEKPGLDVGRVVEGHECAAGLEDGGFEAGLGKGVRRSEEAE